MSFSGEGDGERRPAYDGRMSTTQPTTTGVEVADGDCFPVAYRLAIAEHAGDVRLCHGLVVREHDGLAHPHAWVEVTATHDVPVLDTDRTMPVTLTVAIDKANGHDVSLPAVVYRKVGQAHDVVEYEPLRAMTLAVSSGHFGPWEVGR